MRDELMSVAKDQGLLTGARWVLKTVFKGSWPRHEKVSEGNCVGDLAHLFPGYRLRACREMTIDDPFPTPRWLSHRRDELIKSAWSASLGHMLEAAYGTHNKDTYTGDILRAATLEARDRDTYGYYVSELAHMLEHGKHSPAWNTVAQAVGEPLVNEGGTSYLSDNDPRRVLCRGIQKTIALFLAYAAMGNYEKAAKFNGAVQMFATHVPMCFTSEGDIYLLKL